jgi:hypothetical protein
MYEVVIKFRQIITVRLWFLDGNNVLKMFLNTHSLNIMILIKLTNKVSP